MGWWWGPLCTRPTSLVGFFIELAHWNNSPWVNMSPHLDTLFWFRANQTCSFSLLINAFLGRSNKYHFIVFGLTRPGLEHTISHTRGDHTNHNTADEVVEEEDYYTSLIIFYFVIVFQVSTLRFATRMMCVASEPAMNEIIDPVVSNMSDIEPQLPLKWSRNCFITLLEFIPGF